MVRVRDYSALPEGIKIGEGITEKCPKCGRVGLKENEKFYTHTETLGFENGQPVIDWQMCQV
jgi:hypothetical protein